MLITSIEFLGYSKGRFALKLTKNGREKQKIEQAFACGEKKAKQKFQEIFFCCGVPFCVHRFVFSNRIDIFTV